MCGIIGILSSKSVVEELLSGLTRLEYRGYDSAGIATIDDGAFERRRAEGKIISLEQRIKDQPISGNIGIGHTRWATHGKPTENNAHPHANDKIVVVHNGIIENFIELREMLINAGFQFHSETDTEVIPHLIKHHMTLGNDFEAAFKATIKQLEGAYAIAAICIDSPNILAVTRHGSPLAVGYSEGEMFVGSDAIALSGLTNKISYLDEGDIGFLRHDNIDIYDVDDEAVTREIVNSNVNNISIGKENYRHFMLKEIYEQPKVIGDVLHAYYNSINDTIYLPPLPFEPKALESITIIACGTSYYAGVIASYWLENLFKRPVTVDLASEFRYRNRPISKNSAYIFISQSGETADTLAAMKHVKQHDAKTIAIVNVTESSLARLADITLPIYSGPEIGVASTKAFTTQLVTLACLSISLARRSDAITREYGAELANSIATLPAKISDILSHDKLIEDLSCNLEHSKSMIYIGRGVSYGIAMEGALKLKEISYIHAEAFAAGELKHGPIALIDEDVPIVAIAPSDELFEKTASNIREIASRGGKILLISDADGIENLKDVIWNKIEIPALETQESNIISPILYAVPIQLLAYHIAVHKGTDVDQPRNLAKSVTVE